jgi:hypothetical protein
MLDGVLDVRRGHGSADRAVGEVVQARAHIQVMREVHAVSVRLAFHDAARRAPVAVSMVLAYRMGSDDAACAAAVRLKRHEPCDTPIGNLARVNRPLNRAAA